MNETSAAYNWAAGRGEKWSAQLSGMEATLKPVDSPLIDALHLDAPYRIADVGCGGGGTSFEILHRAPAGSVVHGFDISPANIEAARARNQSPNQSRNRSDDRAVVFTVRNIATAPPPEAPYDRLLSRFGIMFFDDPPAAFANLARWLAPGGRFAFAAWGNLDENRWMTNVREAAAEVVDVPSPDPGGPGPFRYGEADKLLALLDQAGFAELDVCDWRGSLPLGGGLPASEAANFALAAFSSFAELLAKAGDAALRSARQSLTARFSRYQQDGAVRIDACIHIFTGIRVGR